MSVEITTRDEEHIRKCIALSQQALDAGDAPFGSIIVRNGEIVAEAQNDYNSKITEHAEIIALNRAHEALGTSTLADCTLYTSCEPCPMCSFMIREFKISRVVFGLQSLYMGGYSKWNILQDEELENLPPFFAAPPEVVGPVLEEEAKKVLPELLHGMLGSDVRERV